jgi:hypothetical protein
MSGLFRFANHATVILEEVRELVLLVDRLPSFYFPRDFLRSEERLKLGAIAGHGRSDLLFDHLSNHALEFILQLGVRLSAIERNDFGGRRC